MKCSLGISNFLEEISSLPHSILFFYFFALITEEGFLISPCYFLNSALKWVYLSLSPLLFASLLFTAICKDSSDSHFAFCISFAWGWSWSLLKSQIWDFLGGSVNKNSPANSGDTDLIPRKIPHALEQLSPCTTATEPVVWQLLKPVCLEPVLPSKRSHRSEKPAHCGEE